VIPEINTELAGGVLTLTLSRADKKNALTNEMYGALADAIESASTNGDIRVVLVQADGDTFTAGNDVGEFAAQAQGSAPAERHVVRFLHALANATVPIVAAVQGKAVGVGTTMLLHCDYVIVADDAQLITPFVNLALVPEARVELPAAAENRARPRIRDVLARRACPRGQCRDVGHREQGRRWRATACGSTTHCG